MSNELNISLGLSQYADDSDYVIIEQKPWAKDVGRTSNSQGILAIGTMIFGEELFGGVLPLPNCGGADGFDAPVYVYPSSADLNYVFDVSHGGASSAIATSDKSESDVASGKPLGVVGVVTREEVVQCGYNSSANTEYPVQRMVSKQWIGKCYDSVGNVVSRPSVTQKGRALFFSKKVYGSVRVKYKVHRVTYTVRVPERDDSIENNFQSVAFCRWDGGVEYKEIEAPSGYEITLGDCDNGLPDGSDGSTDICPDDRGQGSYPVAVHADRHTKVDYCSQQITSDKVTESVDYDREPGEECNN